MIDVATLKPLDVETILGSVAKTGRCVIVHEAARAAGFGAEISAELAEHGLMSLLAPVPRVASPDVVVPFPKLERAYMPDEACVVDAARRAVSFS